jgi:hypothetical protein
LSAGIDVDETAESNVLIPDPVMRILEIEQFVVVGKLMAVPF